MTTTAKTWFVLSGLVFAFAFGFGIADASRDNPTPIGFFVPLLIAVQFWAIGISYERGFHTGGGLK